MIQRGSETIFTNLWSLLLYIQSLSHYIENAQENKKNTILSYNSVCVCVSVCLSVCLSACVRACVRACVFKVSLPDVNSEVLINWDKSLILSNKSIFILEYLVQTKKKWFPTSWGPRQLHAGLDIIWTLHRSWLRKEPVQLSCVRITFNFLGQ
jgi:hypothetical protein